MKLVIFNKTPLAGATYHHFCCLKRYTNLDVVQLSRGGRVGKLRFPVHTIYSPSYAPLIRQADVVHVHNYLTDEITKNVDRSRQLVIATHHSVPRPGISRQLFEFAHQSFCIRQPYQMREYTECKALPNLLDIFDRRFMPDENRWKTLEKKIRVAYIPSNVMAVSHPASKGFSIVLPILEELEKRFPNMELVVKAGGIPYEENLAIKKSCHIVIDDIVEGHNTFHLTSLEASSFGLAVLTSVGQEDGFPFIKTTTKTLKEVLETLLKNPDLIISNGAKCRTWMEENWNPRQQVKEYLSVYTGTKIITPSVQRKANPNSGKSKIINSSEAILLIKIPNSDRKIRLSPKGFEILENKVINEIRDVLKGLRVEVEEINEY